MVKESQLDMGFVTEPVTAGSSVQRIPLYKERFVLLANPSHPLTKVPEIHISDFKKYTFVIIDPQSSISKIVNQFLIANNMVPDSVIEISSVATIKELLKEEHMITLLPELFAKDEIKKGLLASLAISPTPPDLTTSLIYTNNYQRMDIIDTIIKEVKDIIDNTLQLKY